MTTLANITINDGETVPVAHIFSPKQSLPFPRWREDVAGVPISGALSFSINVKQASTSDGMNRVKLQLALPVMEAIMNQNAAGYTAAPRVAYVLQFNGEFILPMRSTVQNRKNLRSLVYNLLGNAAIIAPSIDNVEQPY